jgi:hypothetical protein
MLIEFTKEQFSELEMLLQLGIYYVDEMEPSNSCYEDDKDTVTRAQNVLKEIEQQLLNGV